MRINKRHLLKDTSFVAGADTIFKANVKLSKREIDRGVTIAQVEFQLKNPGEGNQDWETGMVRERSNPAGRVFNCIFDTTLPDIPGEWKWRLRATDSNGTTKTSEFYLLTIAEGDVDPMTSRKTASSPTASTTTTSIALSVSKTNFAIGEDIVVNFNFPNTFGNGAWVSIWPAEADASALPSPSPYWNYVCSDSQEASSSCGKYPTSGEVTLNADSEASSYWPLTCGTWKVYLIENDATFPSYTSAAATTEFTIANIPDCAATPTTSSPTSNSPTASTTTTSIALSVSKTNFAIGEDIVVNFNFPNTFGNGAWVSIWPAEADASALPSPSPYWNYVCSDSQEASSSCGKYPTSGEVTLNADSEASSYWPLTCGTWKVYLIENDATFPSYTSAAATTEFTIANIPECAGTCPAALEPISTNSHEPPVDGMIVNRIAFSSCFKPANQINEVLWKHVRTTFQAGIWNWLGDNMYMDTDDQDLKRAKYNAARDNQYYSTYGPVANPKIPTTGTWDDHDYAWNNMVSKDSEYLC